jgi:hypothetical protein
MESHFEIFILAQRKEGIMTMRLLVSLSSAHYPNAVPGGIHNFDTHEKAGDWIDQYGKRGIDYTILEICRKN